MHFTDQSSSILSLTTCSGSTGCGTSQESSSEEDEPPAKVQRITATSCSQEITKHDNGASDDREDAASGCGSCGHGSRGRGSSGHRSRGRGSRGQGSRDSGGKHQLHPQTEDQPVSRYVCNVFTHAIKYFIM